MIAEIAITKIFNTIVDKLIHDYEKNKIEKEEIHFLLKKMKNKKFVDKYKKKYATPLSKIRTLTSPEIDVFLDDIYYPLKVSDSIYIGWGDSDFEMNYDKGIPISDGETLDNFDKIVNIIGIAGQGKSTILKKIFFETLKKGRHIPFFIELRNINDECGILAILKKLLNEFELPNQDTCIDYLLSCGNVKLLLDGFDEVSPELRNKVIDEILHINMKYNCLIITSSRPDTELCITSNIMNLKVKKLSLDDCIGILNKIPNRDDKKVLIEMIKNNSDLSSVLISPILVNLLAICHYYWRTIPDSDIGFYKQLYEILYERHDAMKKYSRHKKSKIKSREHAEFCFSGLCYSLISNSITNINKKILLEYLKPIINLKKYPESEADYFIDDVCNVTCLLQKDGFDRYVFIHKSIQEYQAAFFISELDESKKKKFYDKLSTNNYLMRSKFEGVLKFLRQIDLRYYNKFFILENLIKIQIKKIKSDEEQYLNLAFEKMIRDKYLIISGPEKPDETKHYRIDGYSNLEGGTEYNTIICEYPFDGFFLILIKLFSLIPKKILLANLEPYSSNGISDDMDTSFKLNISLIIKYDNDKLIFNMVKDKFNMLYSDVYLSIIDNENMIDKGMDDII